MKPATKFVKEVFHKFGLEISRYRPVKQPTGVDALGKDHLSDIKTLSRSNPTIIVDVGANRGDSVTEFKNWFPQSQVHAFEPSPETYKVLAKNVGSESNVYLNNMALGSSAEKKVFLENVYPNMSSFLSPDELCWGEVVKESPVDVVTLDRYCAEKNIPHISVLKTDTQGFDFEVLKGADALMRNNRIELIFMEIIFSAMYKGLPAFDEVYRYLLDRGFKLVSFYEFFYQKGLASWTDALFLNPNFDYSKSADNGHQPSVLDGV